MLLVCRAKARRQQHGQMPPDRIFGHVAEDLLGAAVEMDDALTLIDGDDRVGRDRENAGEFRLGCPERFLRAALLAESCAEIDVLNDEQGERRPGDQRGNEQLMSPIESPASAPAARSPTGVPSLAFLECAACRCPPFWG